MVTFKKEELDFLNVFVSCIDNKKQGGELFNVKSQDGKIYFSQIGSDVLSFYTIDKNVDSEIDLWYKTQFVNNLVNTLEDGESITFTDNSISLSNSGKYEAEVFSYDNPVLSDMISYTDSKDFEEVKIVDLKKLNKVKQFMDVDVQGLDAIGIMSSYFIGSSGNNTAIAMTDNNFNTKVFLNVFIINLISKYKLEEIDVKILKEQQFYSFDFKGVKIFTPIKIYRFRDNFFDIKDQFMHENKIFIKKEDMLKAINRLKIIAVKDNCYRVFVSYDKNSIEIESKDYIAKKAKEIVEAEVDPILYNSDNKNFAILSNNIIDMIIKNIDGDNIIMRSKPTSIAEDLKVITFTDIQEQTFYIHNVHLNIEVAG